MAFDRKQWLKDAQIIAAVLEKAPAVDKGLRIPAEEFRARQAKVIALLEQAGIDAAFIYSDEHYAGDVAYLGGCTNITIEPIAGVIGRNGFHILAGLEGGYVAEQLAYRSGAQVHKVEMLKLADEEYPIDAERFEDVVETAAGCKPRRIAILTPLAIFPTSMYQFLCEYASGEGNVVSMETEYARIKYGKSAADIRLTEQAALVADVMIEGMLRVLKPGMLETQVASWGYLIAYELGCEDLGFDIMVTSNEANRTLIGKALNRVIGEGDYVHIGVAPKADGLNACERVSVICVDDPSKITAEQKYWMDFVEEAYKTGYDAFVKVAQEGSPAYLQEKALVDFFKAHEEEVCSRYQKKIDFEKLKPYTGTHNTGYTECQEFYGAITLNSNGPMGDTIIMMLDVAARGIGNKWDDVVIPGLDYVVVEKTLAKEGRNVRTLNRLPVSVQHLVGKPVK